MTDVERPENGARFVFELAASSQDKLDYRVTVVAPDADYVFDVTMTAPSFAVTMRAPQNAGLPWYAEMTLAFAKTVASQNKEEPIALWPKRLVRWRQK